MTVYSVTGMEAFTAVARQSSIVVVDFWADWCGPCRAFAPVFQAKAEEHADVTFVKVDVDANPDLAERFSVSAIPTVAFLRDGYLVGQFAGALPGPRLDDLIGQVKALSMEDVAATADLVVPAEAV